MREQAKRRRVELVRAIDGGGGERGVRLEVEGGPGRRSLSVSDVERGERGGPADCVEMGCGL